MSTTDVKLVEIPLANGSGRVPIGTVIAVGDFVAFADEGGYQLIQRDIGDEDPCRWEGGMHVSEVYSPDEDLVMHPPVPKGIGAVVEGLPTEGWIAVRVPNNRWHITYDNRCTETASDEQIGGLLMNGARIVSEGAQRCG